METIQGLLLYWPAISFILFVSVIGQVIKSLFLTKELQQKYPALFWLKRTYPIFLLLLGLIPAFTISGEVVPGIMDTSSKAWFFMGCSGASILGFNIMKQWVKAKLEVTE